MSDSKFKVPKLVPMKDLPKNNNALRHNAFDMAKPVSG